MNNKENNNTKTYIIIAVCCVLALMAGLFSGKAIAGKRKLAVAEKMIAEYETSAAIASSEKETVDELTEETSDAAAEVSLEEGGQEEPQTETKWLQTKRIIFTLNEDEPNMYIIDYLATDYSESGDREKDRDYYLGYKWSDVKPMPEDLISELDDSYAAGEFDHWLRYILDYEYDDKGNLIKSSEPSISLPLIYTPEYNEDGSLKTLDPQELTTHIYQYDENGILVKETSTGDGFENIVEYDEKGNTIRIKSKSLTSEKEHTTEYEYDDNDRQIKSILSDGTVTTFEYDENGNKIKSVSTDGRFDSTFEYDENGNMILETSGTTTWAYEYDSKGNKIKYTVSDSDEKSGAFTSVTEYAYDEFGNLIKETTEDSTTLYEYTSIEVPITQ
jgi:YD repeat-containing protein